MNAPIDWTAVKDKIALSEEEQKIVDLLAQRKSLPDIGRALGQHRSMIWRKVESIKSRLQVT